MDFSQNSSERVAGVDERKWPWTVVGEVRTNCITLLFASGGGGSLLCHLNQTLCLFFGVPVVLLEDRKMYNC